MEEERVHRLEQKVGSDVDVKDNGDGRLPLYTDQCRPDGMSTLTY